MIAMFHREHSQGYIEKKKVVNDMWECQRCGRKFKRTNQGHFCGEPPKSVDSYIKEQPDAIQPRLQELRQVLKQTLPDAEECILWRMPTYRSEKGNIIHFAAATKHIGFYPGDKAVNAFSDRLKDYKSHKGAIQFQNDEPLPLNLISEIAKWCYETGNHH